MAIIQALIAFIGRSAGKIMNAIFGWAVRALFGSRSGAENTLLTGVVALAALWPLLILGIAFPRAAAFILAFVPIPKRFPDWTIRAVWIGLAIAVPGIVGVVLAIKAPPGARREPFFMRLARGYPTTVALAVAFWMSFVSLPVLRLISAARGLGETHIPLITKADSYGPTAERIRGVLNARGFRVRQTQPGFWLRAPMQIMRSLGGARLRSHIPERLAYFRGPDLEGVLYPTSLLLRGPDTKITIAHGLLVEALTPGDALQTTSPDAEDIERQIKRVWRVLAENPAAHTASRWLEMRLADIAKQIARLETPYDDWQTVYRQALQLDRALRGERQLLAQNEETAMEHVEHRVATEQRNPALQQRPTTDLLGEVINKATLLLDKEVELARAELKKDLQAALAMVKGFAVAAVAALITLNLLFVAAVFALLPYTAGWVAALGFAGVTLLVAIVASAIAWRQRIGRPLALTRKTLREDLQWAKEQLA
ncbi:MAG: phage holin family protein [Candidatus Binatia bacterium]